MTAFDRFDPFERRITEAIDEIAAARPPEYLTDILRLTARSSQRPRWTFLERWLPVDTTLPRLAFGGRVPLRALVVVMLLAALLAASLAFYIGSQQRLPAPFGPAANGDLLYAVDGDLYARNPLTGGQRLVIGTEGEQFAATYSPSGEYITYATASAEGDQFMVATADGSNPRQLALIPATGNATAAWAPNSKSVAFIYDVRGNPQLSLVTLGGDTTVVALDGLIPLDVAYAPPIGDRLLIRARVVATVQVGLFSMKLDGSDRRTIVSPATSGYGVQFTRSGAVFAPDGRTIAYNGIDPVTMPDGSIVERFRAHLVNADGTNDRALPAPSDPTVEENWPAFSPDGKSIAVQRWRTYNGAFAGEGWTAIMPADGTQAARDIGPHFTDDEDTALSKLWAPDGSRLVIVVGSKQEVYSIDPASGIAEPLPWTNALPDWQRRAP